MSKRRKLFLGGAAGTALLLAVSLALYAGREGGETADAGGLPSGTEVRQEPDGVGTGDMQMGDGTIRLSRGEVNAFGITFGTAEVRPLTKTIRTTGLIEFDEARMAYVSPKFGGWAEHLYVDFTGERVREGEPLLEIYSPELVTAQEELLLAARMAESVDGSEVEGVASGARGLLESAERRLRYWDISDAQIEELLRSGNVKKTLILHAPAPGIVVEKDVFEGQSFRPGQNLYMIADLSEVWVNAEVFEADAALLREGMPAEIRITALPGTTLRGRVEYVYPTVQETTRSMKARIALPNPTAEIKPGMYATARFTADLDATLTVPAAAILHTGERAVAFVDMGGGRLMPHELTLGQQGEQYVQVLDGLDPGMRVVTSAQFLLDSESNLAEVMKAMMAQMNMSDMGSMDMEGMEGMEDTDTSDGPGMDMPGMRKER